MSEKIEMAMFELINNGSGSGFFLKGTENTTSPQEIKHPKTRSINNKTVIYRKNEHGTTVPVKCRYISGCTEIEETKQVGLVPNYSDDRIVFVNGTLTVPNYGSTVGLFKFMRENARNESNPDRPKDGKFNPLFREIKASEQAQVDYLKDFLEAEAVMYIKKLITEQNGGFVYAEERIDALCKTLEIFSEHYEGKIKALNAYAKRKPKDFLEKAKKSEQTVTLEIQHALQMKVISFTENTAMYVAKNEKIKSFLGKLSDDKKITQLGAYFQSEDGKEAYRVFKVELEAAKDAQISKQ